MDQSHVTFRRARRADLPAIVATLADDALGAARESYATPLPEGYYAAFDAIACDPNNQLLVAEVADEIASVLQLTFIPNIGVTVGSVAPWA